MCMCNVHPWRETYAWRAAYSTHLYDLTIICGSRSGGYERTSERTQRHKSNFTGACFRFLTNSMKLLVLFHPFFGNGNGREDGLSEQCLHSMQWKPNKAGRSFKNLYFDTSLSSVTRRVQWRCGGKSGMNVPFIRISFFVQFLLWKYMVSPVILQSELLYNGNSK